MSIKRSLGRIWIILAVAATVAIGQTTSSGSAKEAAANAPVKFTDKRDGKVYKSVKIGSQVWMAENHNVKTENSWCYGGDEANCKKYGRLYTWDAARKACSGMGGKWRLPTLADMNNLTKAVGGVREEYYDEADEGGDGDNEKYIRYAKAAKKLKSKSGWNRCNTDGGGSDGDDCVANGNGTDDYGFAALPGGSRSPDGQSGSAGGRAYFWGATESGEDYAYRWHIYYGHDDVNEYYESRGNGFSVRCVSE